MADSDKITSKNSGSKPSSGENAGSAPDKRKPKNKRRHRQNETAARSEKDTQKPDQRAVSADDAVSKDKSAENAVVSGTMGADAGEKSSADTDTADKNSAGTKDADEEFANAVATLADATGIIELNPAEIEKAEKETEAAKKARSSKPLIDFKAMSNALKGMFKSSGDETGDKGSAAASDSKSAKVPKEKADKIAQKGGGASDEKSSKSTDDKKIGDSKDSSDDGASKKRERSGIDEQVREVKEILDDALDESAEGLGLAEEQPSSQSISLNQVMSAIFGVLVLGFAIFGMVSAFNIFREYANERREMTAQREYIERLVIPLCASDAPTFESVDSLNSDVIITAACWDVILSPSATYTVQNGYYTVSYLDIDTRVNKLFGSGLTYTHATVGDEELQFVYNEETGMYSIPATPRTLAYYPTIDSLVQTETGYVATVSYRTPITHWIASTSDPDKTMIYTLVSNGISYNIASLEVSSVAIDEEP